MVAQTFWTRSVENARLVCRTVVSSLQAQHDAGRRLQIDRDVLEEAILFVAAEACIELSRSGPLPPRPTVAPMRPSGVDPAEARVTALVDLVLANRATLKRFNAAYRQHRLASLAAGQRSPSYGAALGRLRLALKAAIERGEEAPMAFFDTPGWLRQLLER
jgi:hypothetical protein